MLHIVTGRAGSGKTTYIYNELRKKVSSRKEGQILLVPPQYSHTAEKELCSLCGDSASLYAEALTFRTLANRVFAEGGQTCAEFIDDTGRLILLKRACDETVDLLESLRMSVLRPEFISRLLNTVNELKLYNIAPEELLKAVKGNDSVSTRLSDIAYIYAAYKSVFSGDLHDPADMFDLASELADKLCFFKGKDIYIDSMTGFTPKEYLLLDILIRDADEVYIALCSDINSERDNEVYTDDELFAKSCEIITRLKRYCVKKGIEFEIVYAGEPKKFKNRELSLLERHLFTYDNIAPVESNNIVRVVSAYNKRNECEKCAAQLLEWANEGVRFRDMAVVCRTYGDYSSELEAVLNACSIPVYMDNTDSVTLKPFFMALSAALEAVNDNYSVDSMITLIKTGMTGIPKSACDVLEFYISRWNISGNKWKNNNAWHAHPDGFLQEYTDHDEKKLRLFMKLRNKLMNPLMELKKNRDVTVREHCEALFNYAVKAGMNIRLKNRTSFFRENGDIRLSDEYSQLWGIFCDALDQLVLISGSRPVSQEEFSGLFKLILSGIKVGVIPNGADRVSFGEAGRFRGMSPARVVILGANSAVFPKAIKSDSLISDKERLILREELGIKLDLTDAEQQLHEQYVAYEAIFSACERVTFMYIENTVMLPSRLITRITELFVDAKKDIKLDKCLYMCKNDRRLSSNPDIRRALDESGMKLYDKNADIEAFPKEPLRAPSVDGLYGVDLRMSPSRIEKYFSCRFAFFVEYGLGIRDFKKASFTAVEAGQFIHYVFERLGRAVADSGGWRSVTREFVAQKTTEFSSEFYASFFTESEYQTKRMDFLYNRLCEQVKTLSDGIYDEFLRSEFEPFLFEYNFGRDGNKSIEYNTSGKKLFIHGLVDRADRCEIDGKNYIRIIDYKTGKKELSFTDLYSGLNMQLPLYLFGLNKDPENAAGFFYMPAREPTVDTRKDDTCDKISVERSKALRYRGISTDNFDVIKAMDSDFNTAMTKLPFVYKDISRVNTPVANKERFSAVNRHMEKLLKTMVREIENGEVDCDPYLKDDSSGCDYCKNRPICKYYNKTGNRYLKKLNCDEYFTLITDESEENE